MGTRRLTDTSTASALPSFDTLPETPAREARSPVPPSPLGTLPSAAARQAIDAGAPAGVALPQVGTAASPKPLTPRAELSPGVRDLLDRVGRGDVPLGLPSLVEVWTSDAVWG